MKKRVSILVSLVMLFITSVMPVYALAEESEQLPSERKYYFITPVSGEFQKDPYAEDDDVVYYAQLKKGDVIDLKIDSNQDHDQTIQTEWKWYSNDQYSDEKVVEMSEPTEEGVQVRGLTDGIAYIHAKNENDRSETMQIALYVGDACRCYITDNIDEYSYLREMNVGETIQLNVLTVPERIVDENKWIWSVEEEVIEDEQSRGKVSFVGNTITALSRGDVCVSVEHPELTGEKRVLFHLQIGYDSYCLGDAIYTIDAETKTARLNDWTWYEDQTLEIHAEIPSTLTITSEESYFDGVYTVNEIGIRALREPQIKSVVIPDSVTKIGTCGVGYSEGYEYNPELGYYEDVYRLTPNFIIYGYSDNSAAAEYAEEHGIKYVKLDLPQPEKPVTPQKPVEPVAKKVTEITAKNFTKTYGNKPFSLEAKATSGGKLSYKSSDTKIATVSSDGRVTLKGPGKAIITITAAATANYNTASKNVTVTVKPKKTVGLKVKKGKNRMTVSWKRDKKATGYQITYAQNKKFKKGKKNITISKNKTVKRTIKKLKARKTYYVKVRAYKKVGKTKLYGGYSVVKRVKVR